MTNPVHKGKRGENELCKFCDHYGISTEAERNYNQASGGADVIIPDFIIEVKRREVLDLASWWQQVCVAKQQHRNKSLIQIVAYRQNRKPWQFLLPAYLISGMKKGYLIANERVFVEFARGIAIPKNRKKKKFDKDAKRMKALEKKLRKKK